MRTATTALISAETQAAQAAGVSHDGPPHAALSWQLSAEPIWVTRNGIVSPSTMIAAETAQTRSQQPYQGRPKRMTRIAIRYPCCAADLFLTGHALNEIQQ